MEHTPAQREAIIGGIDTLTQEIIKLKNNLTEILDYIDLRQKEADEQISQHRNLIDSFSDEIKELERILEEKKLLAMPSVRALAKKLGIEINRINRL